MTLYAGQILILLSIVNNLINIIFYCYNFKKKIFNTQKIFLITARLNALIIFCAFISLIYLFIKSDFRNLNVFFNSHSDKPLIYKISGTWGNHEGSLLLWILIMSVYTLIFSFNKSLNFKLKNLTIFFQTIMVSGFIIFMILTSNPFLVNMSNDQEGLGLNPILQDPALAIHPPLLYLGYVGFSIVLSLAIAGLITNQTEKSWVEELKRYTIFCWSMLTLGIATGSFWAYYELGWGGWWFWDPVENASLMPWLAGLALIHSLQIVHKNSQLKQWIIFLSILCFSLSLLGTFLVRSGILMSVHAFANDSYKGIFILILFFIITGFSFLIFLIKADSINNKIPLIILNKSTSLIINNIVMTITCFTVLLGTIYPIILETITNERITVGAPYFNSTIIPIIFPGLLLMGIAPALSWRENHIKNISNYIGILLSIILVCLIIFMISKINPFGIIGLGLSIWIILSSIIQLYKKKIFYKIKKTNLLTKIQTNGGLISHIGVGILILGITVSSVWQKELIKNVKIGDDLIINNYSLKFINLKESQEKNYMTIKGKFIVKKQGVEIGKIIAEKRYYPVSKIITSEAGILHQFQRDIYVVLGENINDRWLVKIYFNPLVSFIWLGSIIMVFGGFLSLKK